MPKSHTVHFVRNGQPASEDLPIQEDAGISLIFFPRIKPGEFSTKMQTGTTVSSTEEMDALVREQLLGDTDKDAGVVSAFFDVDGGRYMATASIARTDGGGAIWSAFTIRD